MSTTKEQSPEKDQTAAVAVPRDAAAIILIRHDTDPSNPETFWARRSAKMAFLGGFHAFPGGQRDPEDWNVPVEGCEDAERASMIACAARELFEELGVLTARGTETLTSGQMVSLLDDLESGRMTFGGLLSHYGLSLNSNDFTYAGRWVTPPFSPRRFDTWFFMVRCPAKQRPAVRTPEFDSGEWISACDALGRWQNSEVVTVPPVLHAIRTLAGGLTEDIEVRFLSVPQAHANPVRRIEFRPGFICFPVRTPTKPPATHTNTYIVGTGDIIVIDPASPYEEEQEALFQCLKELISKEGRKLREIVLTHLHPDHVGGVENLRSRFGGDLLVAAHGFTAEALEGTIRVDRLIEDGDVITLTGEREIKLQAMHTPGHARGHLCFYEEATGALITGDNIVGLGSVLIDPPEGNMADYLHSLRRLRELPGLSVLFGAHGPAMGNPLEKIDEYINHRLERERNILNAVRESPKTVAEIVAKVYTDVHPKALPMAARAVMAHLEKLEQDGLVTSGDDDRYRSG